MRYQEISPYVWEYNLIKIIYLQKKGIIIEDFLLMTSNMFLFSHPLSAERLSWIAESLKYFFVSLHPDALRHPSRENKPFFNFFITGDALYSLHEEESLRIWDITPVTPLRSLLICDRRELDLRGLESHL